MSSIVLGDSIAKPNLFRWNGPIVDTRLRAWLRGHGIDGRIPEDLLEFWRITGGGDLFETETLLGPFADPAMGDDVAGATEFLRQQGLPDRFLVFFRGGSVGAVDLESMEFVDLECDSFRVRRRFRSFDDWYSNTLRDEYRDRYGLR